LTESYQEHQQIADAIEQGDTAAATESLRSNIMKPFVSK
jgi:DNA-binding GntR family transcriptional regulator